MWPGLSYSLEVRTGGYQAWNNPLGFVPPFSPFCKWGSVACLPLRSHPAQASFDSTADFPIESMKETETRVQLKSQKEEHLGGSVS